MGTNMTYQIPQPALDRLNDMVNENRIIRGKWQSTDAQGRETACLLGALGSDITDTKDCPASYMPSWLAELTPAIDDNTSNKNWPSIIKRYANLANRWHVLDEAAWERVKWKTIDASLIIAEPHDANNVIAPVRVLIKRQLSGDPPTQDEWAAAAASASASASAWAEARSQVWDTIATALFDALETEVSSYV
jgi:hypothetical protein